MSADPERDETKQEIMKNEPVDAENEETHAEEDEDSIHTPHLPNRLVVTLNPQRRYRRLPFFVNRARKILRCDTTLTITGVDKAISMACTLVELLKRQKIAKVTKIATNMNLNPNFRRFGGNLAWGQPVPRIVFHMERGDHAELVSDYHQRKVIEIFENRDTEHSGKLKKQKIEAMNLPEIFSAIPEHREVANRFFQSVDGNELNLPEFIRYCSLLIHPLLKDTVFKEKLVTLGVGANEDTNES